MATLDLAPQSIIDHYHMRGLSMQTNKNSELPGIRRVRYRYEPRPIITVTLVSGVKERWVRKDGRWVKE